MPCIIQNNAFSFLLCQKLSGIIGAGLLYSSLYLITYYSCNCCYLRTTWMIHLSNGSPQYAVWGFKLQVTYVGLSIVGLLLQKPPNVWTIYATFYGIPLPKLNQPPKFVHGCQIWNPFTQKNIQFCYAHVKLWLHGTIRISTVQWAAQH